MHALSFFILFSIVVLWLMLYFLFVTLPDELASFSVWLSLSMCWSALPSLYALLLPLYYSSYFDFAPFQLLSISSNMLSFACSCSIFDSIAMFSFHQVDNTSFKWFCGICVSLSHIFYYNDLFIISYRSLFVFHIFGFCISYLPDFSVVVLVVVMLRSAQVFTITVGAFFYYCSQNSQCYCWSHLS